MRARRITKPASYIAGLLGLISSVYLVVALIRQDRKTYALAIAALAVCSGTAMLNVVHTFLDTKTHPRLTLSRSVLAGSTAMQIILAGTALGFAFLSPTRSQIGIIFCRSSQSCYWAGDRALLTAFLLWFTSAMAQVSYLIMSCLEQTTSSGSSLASMMNDTPISSPERVTPLAPTGSQHPFRYPLVRQNTSEEPFSYEAALEAKTNRPPPGHEVPSSWCSEDSSSLFTRKHAPDASHNRSWASTLPTVVSNASSRSTHFKLTRSSDKSTSCAGSPAKLDWPDWESESSMERARDQRRTQAASKQESISNTFSTTSSKTSRTPRTPKEPRFHLPSSPEVRHLDVRAIPDIQNPTNKTSLARAETHAGTFERQSLSYMQEGHVDEAISSARSYSTPRRRRESFNILNLRLAGAPQTQLDEGSSPVRPPLSPTRKRLSILESLKPRLPESRISLHNSRGSWSPTRSHINRSSHSKERRESNDKDAFVEWDTSHIEQDHSYLVSMKDSRDISGPSIHSMSPRGEMRSSIGGGSIHSTHSLWSGRSVRIGSNGSLVLRSPDE